MLIAFTIDYRNHTSLVVRRYAHSKDGAIESVLDVEIHGPSKLQMAIAVLNNYPMKLQILEEVAGPVIVVEAGCDKERLFKALQSLQDLTSPIRRDADFLKNPTVERLEAFVALKKLQEGRTRGGREGADRRR